MKYDDILDKMAGSTQAKAVIDYLEGLIAELDNIDTIDINKAEADVVGRLWAKAKLKKVIYRLEEKVAPVKREDYN